LRLSDPRPETGPLSRPTFPPRLQGHGGVSRLLAARALRSLGQGVLVTDFALYLHALGWSSIAIGTLFMGSLMGNGVLAAFLGPLSDRRGRRGLVRLYELSLLASALVALLTSYAPLLVAATLVGGFGRGAAGAAGPFGAVEQGWLARLVHRGERGRLYSFNMALGFFGLALGAALAGLPDWLSPWLTGADAYRPLFLLVALGAAVNWLLLGRTPDTRTRRRAAQPPAAPLTRSERGLLARLVAVNTLNSLGIGLVGPLFTYWLKLRFGIGPSAIAPVMAVAFALTGAASLGAGRLTSRFGVVLTVVAMRSSALALLLGIALAPWYPLVGVLYVVRSVLNRGTVGARQALAVSLVSRRRSGLAASLNGLSMMLPQAGGAFVAGALLGAGWLAAPFFLAAGLQGAYVVAFRWAFRHHDPSRSSSGASVPDRN